MKKEYLDGFKKGLPIGLGYFTVAFPFGVTAVNQFGFSPLMATIYSMINLSSTGQLAGVEMVFHIASYIEIALAAFSIIAVIISILIFLSIIKSKTIGSSISGSCSCNASFLSEYSSAISSVSV